MFKIGDKVTVTYKNETYAAQATIIATCPSSDYAEDYCLFGWKVTEDYPENPNFHRMVYDVHRIYKDDRIYNSIESIDQYYVYFSSASPHITLR